MLAELKIDQLLDATLAGDIRIEIEHAVGFFRKIIGNNEAEIGRICPVFGAGKRF